MDEVNFEALFLGPQAENHDFFKRLLNFLVDEHIHWRRNFHPYDLPSDVILKVKQSLITDLFNKSQIGGV